MKLYIHNYCPFSTRCLYVANYLSIPVEVMNLHYYDESTTTQIAGEHIVPMLLYKGNVITGYHEIIECFINSAEVSESPIVSKDVMLWQEKALPIYRAIVYPRFMQVAGKDFEKEYSQNKFIERNQYASFNFDDLLERSDDISREATEIIHDAKHIILQQQCGITELADQAVFFSILRGYTMLPKLQSEEFMNRWLHSAAKISNLDLMIAQPLSA